MKFPNKGLLSDADFIEILKDASQSGLTGMIRIENGPVIKVIYFQKGTISFASSNEKTDRLTEVLKRAGKLTPEQVADAQSRLKPNVSLGKTLVELGYISAKDLLWGARAQVDGILHQLLFWNQGKYQITEGTLPREIIHLNLTVPAVIFEGILKTQNRDWILQHIGSPEAIYAIASDYEERSLEYKLPVSKLSGKLNGRRSLHDIAQTSGIDSFELCKTVVALEYLDLARPIQDEPLQMALNTQEPDQPFDLSIEDQPVPTEVEATRTAAAVNETSNDVVLQVSADTEQTETEQPLPKEKEPVTTSSEEPQTEIEEETPQSDAQTQVLSEQPNQEEEITVQQTKTITSDAEVSTKMEPAVPLTPAEVEEIPIEFKKYMQRTPNRISASTQGFNWKMFSLILFAVGAVAAGWFYYSAASKAPIYETPAVTPAAPESQQEEVSQPATDTDSADPLETATIDAETVSSDTGSDSVEISPLDLVRAKRISDAAKMWNDKLEGNRNGYSIQVVIACQDKTVMDTFETLSYSNELMILPMVFKGQNCYRVLYGQYSSRRVAQAAIDGLPDVFLQQRSPASVVAFSKVLS
jgi:hypothetical protein